MPFFPPIPARPRGNRRGIAPRGAVLAAFILVPALLPPGGATPPAAALSYVESSTGLTPPALEGGRTELEIADLDGDGHPDIVSIGDHGNPGIGGGEHGIMVWFGDGHGGWSFAQTGNLGYGGIAVGDVNGDGFPDIGYGMHHNYSGTDLGDQLLEVALGDGTGRAWTAWDDGLATSGETWGMFGTDFADIDGDGDLDVGSVSFGCCAGVHVYRNRGDGTWAQSFGFTGGNSRLEFDFGDVDRDGNPDFVVGHQMGAVYRGDGTGGFVHDDTGLPSPGSLGLRAPDLGDADGDGADELAFVTSNGGVAVYRRDAAGTWQAFGGGLPASGSYEAAQLRDLNSDGLADVAAFGNGTVTVWTGNGSGTWMQAATLTVPGTSNCQAFRVGGDVDHNGFADIALVGEEGSWPSYINRMRFYREGSTPSSLAARVAEPGGGEVFPNGAVRFIEWIAGVPGGGPARARLDVSWTGAGGPWIPIVTDAPDNGRWQWRVTSPAPSTDCRIRLRIATASDTVTAISRPFTIRFAPGTGVDPTGTAASGVPRLDVTPNPSTSGAWINVVLAGGAPGADTPRAGAGALMSIHDVRGRLVFQRRLDGRERAHAIRWDGRDETGDPAPSGIYFVSVVQPGASACARIVISR